MRRLVHSILAKEDLAEIASYKVLLGVKAALRLLRHYPEAGKARGDLRPGLRGYPVRSYVILYRIKPDGAVFIVRVIHGRRDIKAMFQP